MAAYWKIAAYSAYDIFYKYKYLVVNYVFPTSASRVGIFLPIAPFPDRCLLVPFHYYLETILYRVGFFIYSYTHS